MTFQMSSFGEFLYKRMCRVLFGSLGPIYLHSPCRIRTTFHNLQHQLLLPQSKKNWIMPKSIIKRSGTNRRTRAGLTGPLVRRCHTFRRDGYVNEPNFDMEGYEADRDERRELWLSLNAEKDGNRYDRSIDRQVFKDLCHFTSEITGQSFPYCFKEETFANTVANIAFFQEDRKARDELFEREKIVIQPRRSKR